MNATFFDGKIGRGHRAQYVLEDRSVRITYADADGVEQVAVWPLAEATLALWNPADKTRLQFGPFPHQYLDIATTDYNAYFRTQVGLSRTAHTGLYEFVLSRGFRGVVAVGLLAVALLWVFYAYGVPALAAKAAHHVPAEQERQLGETLFRQLESTGDVMPDSALSEQVGQFWRATGIQTRYPLRITVVRSKTQNAFAVPGGRVVVFTGLLEDFKRPEQLAALLAHEAAHVEYRHSLQQLIRSVAAYGVMALLIGDVGGLTGLLAQNADNLLSLSYSRQHEAEADAFAVQALARHGLNPMGAVWLMESLPTTGNAVPTLLRSHPHNAERAAATRALARQTPVRGAASPALRARWAQIVHGL